VTTFLAGIFFANGFGKFTFFGLLFVTLLGLAFGCFVGFLVTFIAIFSFLFRFYLFKLLSAFGFGLS
jgi:hypothetical protein